MNARLSSLLLALGLLAAPFAQAHDPAEHAKEAAEANKGADCSKMDHRQLDMNDPVAQAMMAKCANSGDAHANHGQSMRAEKPAAAPAKPAESAEHGSH